MSVILSFLFVFSSLYDGVDSIRGRLPFQKRPIHRMCVSLQRTDPIVVFEGALTDSSGTLSQNAKKTGIQESSTPH